MTRSEWLPLATSVLVMLLSPLWTTWVSPRLSAANLDKLIGRVVRLFTQIFTSPFVLPPLNVVFNTWLIYKYLHVSDVVTKKLVFGVSTSVGLIVFSTLEGLLLWAFRSQIKILQNLQTMINTHHEVIGDIVKLSRSGSDVDENILRILDGEQQNEEATRSLLDEFFIGQQANRPTKTNRSSKPTKRES